MPSAASAWPAPAGSPARLARFIPCFARSRPSSIRADCSIRARSSIPTRSPRQLAAAQRSPTSNAPKWKLSWQRWSGSRRRNHCNGCGQCRTEIAAAADVPDLPRHARRGRHAPGQGQPDARISATTAASRRRLSSDEVRAVADLCVNCKMCASSARPTSTFPKLMLEAKAANVAAARPGPRRLGLGPHRGLRPLGSAFAALANATLCAAGRPAGCWKSSSACRARRLPPSPRRSFLSMAPARGWTRKPPAGRGRASPTSSTSSPTTTTRRSPRPSVAVLHHNGIEVYVPPGQVGCGMAGAGLRRRRKRPATGCSATSASWPTWPARASRSSASSRPPP